MKWEPWESHKDKAPIKLDISDPPCRDCKFWNPRIKTNDRGEYGGVVLCTVDSMCHDFSCYRENKPVK